VTTAAQLAVVTFAPRLPGRSPDEANAVVQRVVERLVADGYAMVTSTAVRGRTVLRLCLIHAEATLDEVRATVDRLGRFAGEEAARPG
jgi:glutamate/tyrosine decarboxylase-like PLP-dependent enzyme